MAPQPVDMGFFQSLFHRGMKFAGLSASVVDRYFGYAHLMMESTWNPVLLSARYGGEEAGEMRQKVLDVILQRCTGCHSCELTCSFHKEKEFDLTKARIRVVVNEAMAISIPATCMQCTDAPVYGCLSHQRAVSQHRGHNCR